MGKIAIIGLSGESIFLKSSKLLVPSVTTHASECHIEPGGKGYNQAVAARKLGLDVSYLTKIGNDTYGKYTEDFMKNLGINTFFVKDDVNQTALATIITDDKGENEVIVYPGASATLSVDDLLLFENEIKSADYLLLQYEIDLNFVKKAIEVAKKNDTKVILNPAPAIYCDLSVLNSADIVTPNLEEAKKLYNIPQNYKQPLEIGEYLKDKNDNILIVTLGKKGALLVESNKCHYYKPYQVDAVDTTGAGDIFNASLIVGLDKYNNLDRAIKFAMAASAISVTKHYVMDAIPTFDEVEEFLKNHI